MDKNDRSLGCLNDQLKAKVDEVNPTLATPPIDAKSSDLKVGTVNVPGVQQQYGKNFGKSVVPYRPPPPVYNGIGGSALIDGGSLQPRRPVELGPSRPPRKTEPVWVIPSRPCCRLDLRRDVQ